MSKVNLDKLSTDEIQELITKAQDKLKSIQEEQRNNVIAEIKELAKSIDVYVTFGPSSSRISKRKGVKVAAKYRLGDNEWSGRGMKPKWMREQLDNGKSLEDFLI